MLSLALNLVLVILLSWQSMRLGDMRDTVDSCQETMLNRCIQSCGAGVGHPQ